MLKIFKKDINLFLKDKRAMLLTFILPVILITLFAFAFSGLGGENNKVAPIQLIITDQDNTPITQKIIAELEKLQGISLKKEKLILAKNQLQKGNVVGVLVFYKGLKDSVVQRKSLPMELFYDKAQSMQVSILQPLLMNTILRISVCKPISAHIGSFVPSGIDKCTYEKILRIAENEHSDLFSNSLQAKMKLTSLVGQYKDNILYLIQSVAGVAIMMLLFSITTLSSGLLEEKENGTLNRLLYSPLQPINILMGKMLTAFTISMTQLTIMFVFAWLAFGLKISKNFPALIMLIVSISFSISSIGIFIASIARTRAHAQGLGTIINLTMSAIGGSMVPLYIMPAIMKKASVFSINYWGIEGFYDIFWRGLPTSEILTKIVILMGIGAILTFLSIRLFKRNILRII